MWNNSQFDKFTITIYIITLIHNFTISLFYNFTVNLQINNTQHASVQFDTTQTIRKTIEQRCTIRTPGVWKQTLSGGENKAICLRRGHYTTDLFITTNICIDNILFIATNLCITIILYIATIFFIVTNLFIVNNLFT